MIKWSLIEVLSACICGNLLPLRPFIEKFVPPFRSIYSWYFDRKTSRKSSKKNTSGSRVLNRFSQFGGSRKPRLISTLHFTKVSLSPMPTSGWDWKKPSNLENTMVLPRNPIPAHLEKSPKNSEEDYVQDVPFGRIMKTSTTGLRSTQTQSTMTSSQKTMVDSVERPSRDGSESDLMPPTREREHHVSGPWSRAFAVLDRR